ncbi:hypothetical protein OIU83_11280 [Flavobacterium sp. LS1R49]|uniref:Uncharacterized protein n=1 Tax=Flavobacterium shii TaxID=2987687 RepID=A0A9X3BYQ2_9FLAO|nr:hypothetical protein [Flavobacterium shii]MCV9928241.1 hypothetical protein [Flavobacterium shii]
MRKIFLFLCPLFLNFSEYKNLDIELHIVNTKIKSGEMITFKINNNSNINYCFIIDTLFPDRGSDYYYYQNAFINPQLLISDSKNETNSPWIKEIFYNEKQYEKLEIKKHSLQDKLSLIFIKKNSEVKFSLPFDLAKKIDEGTIMYYKLNNKEKYKCEIEYFIKQEFINNKFSKKRRDSVQHKGYVFFTGSLKSNKVPLEL